MYESIICEQEPTKYSIAADCRGYRKKGSSNEQLYVPRKLFTTFSIEEGRGIDIEPRDVEERKQRLSVGCRKKCPCRGDDVQGGRQKAEKLLSSGQMAKDIDGESIDGQDREIVGNMRQRDSNERDFSCFSTYIARLIENYVRGQYSARMSKRSITGKSMMYRTREEQGF